jgi:Tfp pilus assembly major pilin PilA
LIDNFLASKEISKFNDVVYVVAILDIVGFVYHTYVVEDVVFTHHELKQDDTHWPDVGLV